MGFMSLVFIAIWTIGMCFIIHTLHTKHVDPFSMHTFIDNFSNWHKGQIGIKQQHWQSALNTNNDSKRIWEAFLDSVERRAPASSPGKYIIKIII